jgi:hypothetical protein
MAVVGTYVGVYLFICLCFCLLLLLFFNCFPVVMSWRNRYAVAALSEYRPIVLQLGEAGVCAAAVASMKR